MTEYFEISGTHIRFSEITDFKIIKREYIFRPVYREDITVKRFGRNIKCITFDYMQPYAAIKSSQEQENALAKYNPANLIQSVAKDVLTDVRTTLGDALNIKAIRAKKLMCVNEAGRVFYTYLDDVPAVLIRADGKVSDVMKNDQLYPSLGEPIAPTIDFVDTLQITTPKERFEFPGASIQLTNPIQQYNRLKCELEQYLQEKQLVLAEQKKEQSKEAKAKLPKLPNIVIPQIPAVPIPTIKIPEIKLPGSTQKSHHDTEK